MTGDGPSLFLVTLLSFKPAVDSPSLSLLIPLNQAATQRTGDNPAQECIEGRNTRPSQRRGVTPHRPALMTDTCPEMRDIFFVFWVSRETRAGLLRLSYCVM